MILFKISAHYIIFIIFIERRGYLGFEIDIFFIKTDPNKYKFYKIYHFNFISQKLSAATQRALNFKIEILYVKLKAYKTPIFRAIQT